MMLIDETTTSENRQEVATNLVKLFLGQGLIEEFLDVLFKLELRKTSTRLLLLLLLLVRYSCKCDPSETCDLLVIYVPDEPNILFRSNSLASKSMESFLKVMRGIVW